MVDVVVCVSNEWCQDSDQVFSNVVSYQVNPADNGSEEGSFLVYLEKSIKAGGGIPRIQTVLSSPVNGLFHIQHHNTFI